MSVARPDSKKVARPKKPTRAEKATRIRADLMKAAGEVVGQKGYQGAQILAITAQAKVANGTFYNYFETQQDIFDQLLPGLGRTMIEDVAERSRNGQSVTEREVMRFDAFFDYVRRTPQFYRILYEAQVFAPAAFEAHMAQVFDGYERVLGRASERGELPGYDARERLVLAIMLTGIRDYLAQHFIKRKGLGSLPGWVSTAFEKFVSGGLRYEAPAKSGNRTTRSAAKTPKTRR